MSRSILAEVRQAIRRLVQSPLMTVVLVATLGIVIGAGATVGNLLDRTMIRPFTYSSPDELVQIWATMPQLGIEFMRVSPADFHDLADQAGIFDEVVATRGETLYLDRDGQPEETRGIRITADPARLFGLRPVIGRGFLDEDFEGGVRVVLIGEALWRRRFGAEPAVIGQELFVNDERATIVGVLPSELWYPVEGELWLPLRLDYEPDRRGDRYLGVVGRLAESGNLPGARQRVADLAERLAEEHPQTNTGVGMRLVTLGEQVRTEMGSTVKFATAALALLLLIAAVTVANTLTARGLERRREMAVRIACGAGTTPLIRLLLAENLVLCLLGGALGISLAIPGATLLSRVGSETLGAARPVSGALSIALAGVLVAVVLAVAVSIALWLQMVRSRWSVALREGAQTESVPQARLKQIFLITQVGLCGLLMIACGLLIATVGNLRAVDPGFTTDNGLSFRLTLPPNRYSTPASRAAFFGEVLDGLRDLSGVREVGGVSHLPLAAMGPTSTFHVEGRAPEEAGELRAGLRIVTADYFRAMGIPVLRGRGFTGADRTGVVLINQAMVSTFWKGRDALGDELVIGAPEEIAQYGQSIPRRIVGIVRDVRHEGLRGDAQPEMYVPIDQAPPASLYVVLRTGSEPMSLVAPAREAIARIDPRQPLTDISSLGAVVAASMRRTTVQASVLGCFAAISVVLTLLTVYAVVSHSVARRAREMGIRMAFGARRQEVVRLILSRTAVAVVVGLAIGAGSALVLMRLASSLLFGVTPAEPEVYLTVLLVLFGLSMLASWVPARRIAGLPPRTSLGLE